MGFQSERLAFSDQRLALNCLSFIGNSMLT